MPQSYTQEPAHQIAEETFAMPYHLATPVGVMTAQPLVIRAREPVVVDTGVKWFREAWLASLFELVEPRDVRWIFVSHDDADHIGNLGALMDACPQARIVTSYVGQGRLADDLDIPRHRVVFTNHGESFSAGDRTLTCLRPPLFDSPATRGLHDSRTGLYYAVDSFGAFLPRFQRDADDVPPADYAAGFDRWNRLIHPWHEYADPARIEELLVRPILELAPTIIASYHGPVLRNRTAESFRRMMQTITMGPLADLTQRDVEALVRRRPLPARPSGS